jgi:hypothetical protein
LEPGRRGPFIDAVLSGLNDYTHWRPVPMETGRTTTTYADRAALRVSYFSRHLDVRINVHDSLPSDVQQVERANGTATQADCQRKR